MDARSSIAAVVRDANAYLFECQMLTSDPAFSQNPVQSGIQNGIQDGRDSAVALSAPASANKFPKSARILSSSHYKHINRKGAKLFGEQISVTICQGRSQGESRRPRLGITVSRKYGKAHDRNRFKRVIREAFRELSPSLPPNVEINIFPKSRNSEISKQAVLVELKTLISRIYPIHSAHSGAHPG